MKANADKSHYAFSKDKLKANITNYTITNSDNGKLLRVRIGKHLKIETRMENVCSQGSQELYALSGVSSGQNDEIVHYAPFWLMPSNIDEP